MAVKSTKTKTKDATSGGAQEVNKQLVNASGIGQNKDQNAEKPVSNKGDKNKKTTEGTIPGKEKAKNARKQSLAPKDSDPDKSDAKSNRDQPKAEKTADGKNKRATSGDSKPKKKTEEQKSK